MSEHPEQMVGDQWTPCACADCAAARFARLGADAVKPAEARASAVERLASANRKLMSLLEERKADIAELNARVLRRALLEILPPPG